MANRTSELKSWKMATSKSYRLSEGVKDGMPDTLLMSDACLLALVKKAEDLDEEARV